MPSNQGRDDNLSIYSKVFPSNEVVNEICDMYETTLDDQASDADKICEMYEDQSDTDTEMTADNVQGHIDNKDNCGLYEGENETKSEVVFCKGDGRQNDIDMIYEMYTPVSAKRETRTLKSFFQNILPKIKFSGQK